jgi:calcineurin-like phosphoesterase family protein
MAYELNLNQLNLITWLGLRSQRGAPRIDSADVISLAASLLQNGAEPSTTALREVAGFGRAVESMVDGFRSQVEISDRGQYESRVEWVEPVRAVLTQRFGLFGIFINGPDPEDQFDSALPEIVNRSNGSALLMPVRLSSETLQTMFDPSSIMRRVLDAPGVSPLALIWEPDGASAMLNEDGVQGIIERTRGVATGIATGSSVQESLVRLGRVSTSRTYPTRNILHLSDLHVRKNMVVAQTMASEISNHIRDLSAVVVTGDLFDSREFAGDITVGQLKDTLERILGPRPIVIAGNHDRRKWGVSPIPPGYPVPMLTVLTEDVQPDPASQCIFVKFDSNLHGAVARGEVADATLTRLGRDLANLRTQPYYDSFLTVALVHHHPFTMAPADPSPVKRRHKIKANVQSPTVEFVNASRFRRWCAENRVSLILHGHKHLPWFQAEWLWSWQGYKKLRGVNAGLVAGVGCGSSTGKKPSSMWVDIDPDVGRQMSFNLVVWSPRTSAWSVKFFRHEPGTSTSTEFGAVGFIAAVQ